LYWVTIMLAFSSSLLATRSPSPRIPARLALYYGYPSLVNGSRGDAEKSANVFSSYDVVVLGDGIEFRDRRPGRSPQGDPAEHAKTLRIISSAQRKNPRVRFYGYVCLGEMRSRGREKVLSSAEIKERIALWKHMGASGIFLDEAGYDWPIVDRKRQNLAVEYIHEQGLSAFANAFYAQDLFSVEDLHGKNPAHLRPLLDERDLFLLESFQVKNGAYEDISEWQQRLQAALDGRRRYQSQIFAATTNAEQGTFAPEKFSYAWWSAWLYDLDGFGWGEPDFAALSNLLPDRRCQGSDFLLAERQPPSIVGSDGTYFYRTVGPYTVVVDTRQHAVHVGSPAERGAGKQLPLPNLLQTPAFDCGERQ
jgi:hypothetical protein